MNTNSRTTNSIRSIITGFLGQFIQIVLGFISRTVFISYLGAQYLGASGLFTNILTILSMAEMGVGSAIVFSLYKPLAEQNKSKISSLMKIYKRAYNIIGLIIAVIGLSLMPFLHTIIGNTPNIKESIYIIYLLYLFNTASSYFFSYKASIITADQRNYIVQLLGYVVALIQTILQIVIIITTQNFLLYLIIQSICTFFNNYLISKKADKLYPFINDKNVENLDRETKNNIITNIRALVTIKLGGVLVNSTDNIIISYFLGITTVGLSSNYNLLIGIINTILTQLFGGITSSVGNLNAKEDLQKKRSFFNMLNFMNFWLFGFSSIGIVLFINDIICFWIGESYIFPMNIVVIMAINFYMVGMQNAVWTFKNTMGLFKYGRYLIFGTGILNIILSILLGKVGGIAGILLATAISRALTNAWYEPYVVYKHGLNISPKSYFFKYLIYIFIIIGLYFLTNNICSYIPLLNIGNLLIRIFISTVIINTIIIIIFYNTEEFKYVKDIILQVIRCFNKRKLS